LRYLPDLLLGAKKENLDMHKEPSGIKGLDEIGNGGLPHGRTTLVCGGPGCGKSLFGMQFLTSGASFYDQRGLFLSFEEEADGLEANFGSLDLELDAHLQSGMVSIEHVPVSLDELVSSGSFDLSGLFARIDSHLREHGGKRVVLDGIDEIFFALENKTLVRSELRRLIRWLGEHDQTSIITAEQGTGSLTRNGLEEYVADCVIALDQIVHGTITSRQARIIKYRGSAHVQDSFPFVITNKGIIVTPATSIELDYTASADRISTGIAGLDEMFGGEGIYRGSTVLLSGSAGSGKTTVAMCILGESCRREERALYFGFEESPSQIVRDLASVGLDLSKDIDRGLLRLTTAPAGRHSLEANLIRILEAVDEFDPAMVVLDPVTAFASNQDSMTVWSMALRVVHALKAKGITAILTDLTVGGQPAELSGVGISSIADTWIILRDQEIGAERNRLALVLKSRGMAHSNQLREFMITGDGIAFTKPYVGVDGVLTGSARITQEAREREDAEARARIRERLERDLAEEDRRFDAQLAELKSAHASAKDKLCEELEAQRRIDRALTEDRAAMAAWRHNRTRQPETGK